MDTTATVAASHHHHHPVARDERDVQHTAIAPRRPPRARRSGRGRKREQQDSRLYNLRLDLIDLQQQIQQLTSARDLLVSRALNRYDDLDGSSAKAVIEYFRVFRHGLLLSPVDAIAFLHEIMTEDVLVNNFAGRDLVVEQWKAHSLCFKNLDFRVLDTVVIPLSETQAIVKCHARSTATITRLTLALMFPHILSQHYIVPKLLGKSFTSYGQYDFVYDCETRRFVRCDVVMDLMTAFAALLTDPRELAMLFDQALITDEFYIGDTGDDPPMRTRPAMDQPLDANVASGQDDNEASTSTPHKMDLSHVLTDDGVHGEPPSTRGSSVLQ